MLGEDEALLAWWSTLREERRLGHGGCAELALLSFVLGEEEVSLDGLLQILLRLYQVLHLTFVALIGRDRLLHLLLDIRITKAKDLIVESILLQSDSVLGPSRAWALLFWRQLVGTSGVLEREPTSLFFSFHIMEIQFKVDVVLLEILR